MNLFALCKVFPITAVRNVTLMPHTFYDGPGLLAAIHVTAARGTDDAMIEWRRFDLDNYMVARSPRSTVGLWFRKVLAWQSSLTPTSFATT